MTGILHDVLHEQADSLDAPRLDVAAIIRDGEQHRTRRRREVVGGLVAASLVVAAGVATTELRPGEDVRPEIGAGVHSYDVAYALGSTIHDGPRTVDTGLRIAGLVQGISGYVVADRGGRVHTVVDGEITQVGRLAEVDRPRIVADGDVVAWVDAADGGTISVLDLATGERVDTSVDAWPGDARVVAPGALGDGQAAIAAVDGRTVYVTDTRGVMAWDALDGDDPVLLPAPEGMPAEVRDVQDGRILHVVSTFEPEEVGGATTMVEVREQRVGEDLDDGQAVPGTGGRLSPDGNHLAVMARSTREGGPTGTMTSVGEVDGDVWTPVTSPQHWSIVVSHWLDADSFVATGMTEGFTRSDLLSCEVSTSTCTTVRAGDASALVLPTGFLFG